MTKPCRWFGVSIVTSHKLCAIEGVLRIHILYTDPDISSRSHLPSTVTRLAYSFSFMLREARKQASNSTKTDPKNKLTIPEDIGREFKGKRLDVRNFNEGNGLAFRQIYDQLDSQVDKLKRIEGMNEYDLTVVERMKKADDQTDEDTLFLEVLMTCFRLIYFDSKPKNWKYLTVP